MNELRWVVRPGNGDLYAYTPEGERFAVIRTYDDDAARLVIDGETWMFPSEHAAFRAVDSRYTRLRKGSPH